MNSLTRYLCVFRSGYGHGCWVGFEGSHDSEARARAYAERVGIALVAVIPINPGICPPVGMRDSQCSHVRVIRNDGTTYLAKKVVMARR